MYSDKDGEMNERIKELREQAFDWVQQQLYTVGSDHPVMQNEQLEMINQKFAELIVRECANRLRETDYELMFVEDGMCDPSISDAMLVAASDIEEHFGVEE